MNERKLSLDYIEECVVYNGDDGTFTWRKRPISHFKSKRDCNRWNNRYAGQVAGMSRESGRTRYSYIKINKVRVLAHRLAWYIEHGKPPSETIDHINGDGLDNRIANLRDVSHRENTVNQINAKSNNKWGVNGVRWRKQRSHWQAFIMVLDEAKYLGSFDNFFDAVCARKSAENRYGFCNV